jgi:hypothetical protein
MLTFSGAIHLLPRCTPRRSLSRHATPNGEPAVHRPGPMEANNRDHRPDHPAHRIRYRTLIVPQPTALLNYYSAVTSFRPAARGPTDDDRSSRFRIR